MRYYSVLIFGSPEDKALCSFRVLDIFQQGFITIKDIKRMIEGMTRMWNSFTGSRVQTNQDYIEYFFAVIDVQRQGKVSQEELHFKEGSCRMWAATTTSSS